MVILIPILLVVLGVVVVTGIRRSNRLRRQSAPDDVRRVGDGDAVDPHEAARRAQGRTAWTRMSGGI